MSEGAEFIPHADWPFPVSKQPEALRLADALEVDKWHISGVTAQSAADELRRLHAVNQALLEALKYAEAGLADIGDADREPGDDLAWCEQRAADALPTVRAAVAKADGQA